jgi:hypothetical protein
LKKAGWGEAEIAGAIDAGRGQYKNGHDKGARDVLPRNASGASERGGGFPNAHMSGGRTTAMDAVSKRLAARVPGLARISCLPSVRSSDRHGMDQARTPSRARQAKTLARYPGMERISGMDAVGHVNAAAPAPAARSRFEV